MSSPERSPGSIASDFDQDDDSDVDKLHPTPPTSSTPAPVYSFRDRKMSKLVYDSKYHPMDDAIRPTQAAKRRAAHGEEQVCFDSDGSSEASTAIHTDAEESDDERGASEDEPREATRSKKHKLTQSQPLASRPTRCSSRKVSTLKVSYNMDVHPQDEFLLMSSDEELMPRKKAKRSRHERPADKSSSDNSVAAPKPVKRKFLDYVENSTCDELESDSGSALPSIEASIDGTHLSNPLCSSFCIAVH